MPKAPTLTTAAGAPVVDNQNSQTAGRAARYCSKTIT
jgi:catalase